MAKVVGPLNSIEARGRVGALVYNTWRGIHTVKTHTDPATQYSDKQVELRALGSYCVAVWQAMSDDERRLWDIYASEHPDADWSGHPRRISGYNMFLRINVRALLLEESESITPPTISLAYTLDGIYTSFTPPNLYLRWTGASWPDYDDYRAEIYCSVPHIPTRHPSVKDCLRDGYTYASDGVYTIPATSGLYTTCFVRLAHISGLVGEWQSARGYKP